MGGETFPVMAAEALCGAISASQTERQRGFW